MAIQMRRGLYSDFDPTKMLPGEWAVAIDSDTNKQVVWMCFAPGVVKRMGTYEDFKQQIADATGDIKNEYIAEFQAILDGIEKLAEQTSTNTDTVIQIRDDTVNTYLPQMLEYLNGTADNAQAATEKANEASDYAKQSQSYAVGGTGTRENEDIDCSVYYYEQIKQISQGLNGIIPMGTITFNNLPTSDMHYGDMYNISDEFLSDERFNDGGGIYYGAGSNVIWVNGDKWDVTAGSCVTGMKGEKESTYRQGYVNITPENIGALSMSSVDSSLSSTSTNPVQNKVVDEAITSLNDDLGAVWKIIYPIGSIYMSVNSTSPQTLFGGTWTQIQNTFLLAAGTSYQAGTTGGEASHTLSIAELPSHNHSIGAHSHGLNNHTHSIPALSGTTSSSGEHNHYGKYDVDASSGTNKNRVFPSYSTSGGTQAILTNNAGAHTHTVTTTASTTGAASGSTANSTAFNSGSAGSGTAHNNMPPYLAVYMWKRTA